MGHSQAASDLSSGQRFCCTKTAVLGVSRPAATHSGSSTSWKGRWQEVAEAVCAQVMSMIPGLANMPGGGGEEGNAHIKQYMCIMDSMTNKELDSTDSKIFQVLLT